MNVKPNKKLTVLLVLIGLGTWGFIRYVRVEDVGLSPWVLLFVAVPVTAALIAYDMRRRDERDAKQRNDGTSGRNV